MLQVLVFSPLAQLSWAICHLWAEHRCPVKVPLMFWFLFWLTVAFQTIFHPKTIFWFWKSLQYHLPLIIRGLFTHIWSSASSSISHPQCTLEVPTPQQQLCAVSLRNNVGLVKAFHVFTVKVVAFQSSRFLWVFHNGCRFSVSNVSKVARG